MCVYLNFVGYPMKAAECKPQQLTAIGNRLLDWFSVIMADSKKRRQHSQKSKGKIHSSMCTTNKTTIYQLNHNTTFTILIVSFTTQLISHPHVKWKHDGCLDIWISTMMVFCHPKSFMI